MRRRLITALLFVVMGYGVFASLRNDWFGRSVSSDGTAPANPPASPGPPTGLTSPRSAGDSITVTNFTGTGTTTLVLDGRRAGACFGNEIHRTATSITIPNVETAGSCTSSRLFAMAPDHALLRVEPSFTPSDGDVVAIKMAPVPKVPVTVWIAHGPVTDAEVDVYNANVLYNTMQCGVRFAPATFTDRSSDSAVAPLKKANCGDVSALRTTVGFTLGQLNVYYIEQINLPQAPHGIACKADDGADVVLVASGAFLETLAHEIGHTFTLAHSNGLAVPFNNLMLDGAPERETVTTGQCIRANLNPSSSIALGVPARPESAGCADQVANAICPALVFDVNSQQ